MSSRFSAGRRLAWPLAASAQQVGKVHRIAVVHPSHPIANLSETGPIIFFRTLFKRAGPAGLC